MPKEFHDYLGRLVTPGCFVVYATSQGSSSVRLHTAKVLSLASPISSYERWKIKIASFVDKSVKARRTTLMPYTGNDDCCIVLVEPQNIPKERMDVLDKEH